MTVSSSSTAALDGVITQQATNASTTYVTSCGGQKDLGFGRCLNIRHRMEKDRDLVGLELARLGYSTLCNVRLPQVLSLIIHMHTTEYTGHMG